MANNNEGVGFSLEENYNIDNQTEGQTGNTNTNSGDNAPFVVDSSASEDVLTADAAKSLGGIAFDLKGNLIDNQGKVLMDKTAAVERIKAGANQNTSDAPLEPGYYIDENENVVNEKGVLVKKKGEYTTNAAGEIVLTNTPRIKSLVDQYVAKGFAFKNENGEDVTFDTDDDAAYVKFTELVSTQTANQKLQNTLNAFPEVKALMQHILTGKEPKDFYKSRVELPSYDKLSVADDDTNGRKSVLMDYFTRVGNLDAAVAETMINLAEDAGTSKGLLTTAIAGLKKWQSDKVAAETQEVQAQLAAQETKQKAHWDNVKSIVTNGKLKDINIPDVEKDKFFAYIAYTADENRKVSQAALEYEALSLEDKIAIDYLIYKKFDFDTLIKSRVAQEQVNRLKMRRATVATSSNNPVVQRSTGSTEGLSIKTIN